MTPEQAQKLLDKLQEVKSEQLEGEARKLFEAIMKIADERDSLKIKVVNQQERIDYLMRSIERKEQSLIEEHEENIECYTMIEKKDKQIELLIRELYKRTHISTKCYLQNSVEECMQYKNCYECIRKYFENKVKEVQ